MLRNVIRAHLNSLAVVFQEIGCSYEANHQNLLNLAVDVFDILNAYSTRKKLKGKSSFYLVLTFLNIKAVSITFSNTLFQSISRFFYVKNINILQPKILTEPIRNSFHLQQFHRFDFMN